MIIFEKRLVFVHIPKTGGSSIHYALTGDEACRHHEQGHRNHISTLKQRFKKNFPVGMHGTFAAHQRRLGRNWTNFVFFAVRRNPWELFYAVHRYRFRVRNGRLPISLSELEAYVLFLPPKEQHGDPHFHQERTFPVRYHALPNVVILDFDNLSEEWMRFARHHGLRATLETINSTGGSKAYSAFFERPKLAFLRTMVALKSAQLIKRYGYVFDQ